MTPIFRAVRPENRQLATFWQRQHMFGWKCFWRQHRQDKMFLAAARYRDGWFFSASDRWKGFDAGDWKANYLNAALLCLSQKIQIISPLFTFSLLIISLFLPSYMSGQRERRTKSRGLKGLQWKVQAWRDFLCFNRWMKMFCANILSARPFSIYRPLNLFPINLSPTWQVDNPSWLGPLISL